MRIISWNVARRSSRLADQAMVLAERRPDVVALQEVTRRTAPLWRRAFEMIGMAHVRTSLEEADPAREPATRRATGVLIAARDQSEGSVPLPLPWPETTTAARVRSQRTGQVEVHCVHVPNASNGWIKVRTLEAIRTGLASASPGARIVCGDLNTPRRELPGGQVISFARDSRGRLHPERGAEWDEAELGVVPGLSEIGYADAFRSLHGYERREPSWTWRRIAGHSGGWRLDHLFTSSQLRPTASLYHHEWREAGLSDHSAIEVDVERRADESPGCTCSGE